MALGRLPAETAEEAAVAADKVIGYELDSPLEPWRDKIILVADDELSSFENACETTWTDESEVITFARPGIPHDAEDLSHRVPADREHQAAVAARIPGRVERRAPC